MKKISLSYTALLLIIACLGIFLFHSFNVYSGALIVYPGEKAALSLLESGHAPQTFYTLLLHGILMLIGEPFMDSFVWIMKLPFIAICILSFLSIYLFVKEIFPSRQATALICAYISTLSFYPLSQTLIGIDHIALSALICLFFFAFFRAINSQETNSYILAGICLGLSQVTSHFSVVLPILFFCVLVFLVLIEPYKITVYFQKILYVMICAIATVGLLVYSSSYDLFTWWTVRDHGFFDQLHLANTFAVEPLSIILISCGIFLVLYRFTNLFLLRLKKEAYNRALAVYGMFTAFVSITLLYLYFSSQLHHTNELLAFVLPLFWIFGGLAFHYLMERSLKYNCWTSRSFGGTNETYTLTYSGAVFLVYVAFFILMLNIIL